jgi:hypothetical protein
MKSIDIVSQGLEGFGKGYKLPGGFVVLAFILWQVAHNLQYFLTYLAILGHQNDLDKLANVLS